MPRFVLKRQIVKEGGELDAKSIAFILSVTSQDLYEDDKLVKAYEVVYLEPVS